MNFYPQITQMMQSQARELLSDDHHAVSEVLQQLLMALDNKDVQTSYSRLDLFWARLAVHIRAEHLHLFPAVINHFTQKCDRTGPEVSQAQAIVDQLRADHDFFMHELARAIAILRELPHRINSAKHELKLAAVKDIVREIEERLATHNKIEETQVYDWSTSILTESERLDLLARINAELGNRPPRFSAEAWANLPG
jgi:hemerythrin superfamily protein